MASLARSHAQHHFPTDAEYKRRQVDANPWGEMRAGALCLTGDTGVGKSALLDAFGRFLGDPKPVDVQGLSNVRLTSYWQLSLRYGTGLNSILRPVLYPPGSDVSLRKNLSIPALLEKAQHQSWNEGVCAASLDELQEMARSGATARAINLLDTLRKLGSRTFYCVNYKLLSKMLDDAPEHQHWLFESTFVLLPEAQGSPASLSYIDEIKKIEPDVLTFDTAEAEEELHQDTFNLRRNIAHLLPVAYRLARKRGRKCKVTIDDIKDAYKHRDYLALKRDVEKRWTQFASGKCEKVGLWNPFHDDSGFFWDSPIPNPVSAEAAGLASHEEAVNDRLIDGSARRSAQASKSGGSASKDRPARGHPGTPMPRKSRCGRTSPQRATKNRSRAASDKELLDGADYLDQLSKSRRLRRR